MLHTIFLLCEKEQNSRKPKAFHTDPQYDFFSLWSLDVSGGDPHYSQAQLMFSWLPAFRKLSEWMALSLCHSIGRFPKHRCQVTMSGGKRAVCRALQAQSPRLGLSWMPTAQHRMNTFFLLPSGYRVDWPGLSWRHNTLPKSNETLHIVQQSSQGWNSSHLQT